MFSTLRHHILTNNNNKQRQRTTNNNKHTLPVEPHLASWSFSHRLRSIRCCDQAQISQKDVSSVRAAALRRPGYLGGRVWFLSKVQKTGIIITPLIRFLNRSKGLLVFICVSLRMCVCVCPCYNDRKNRLRVETTLGKWTSILIVRTFLLRPHRLTDCRFIWLYQSIIIDSIARATYAHPHSHTDTSTHTHMHTLRASPCASNEVQSVLEKTIFRNPRLITMFSIGFFCLVIASFSRALSFILSG